MCEYLVGLYLLSPALCVPLDNQGSVLPQLYDAVQHKGAVDPREKDYVSFSGSIAAILFKKTTERRWNKKGNMLIPVTCNGMTV